MSTPVNELPQPQFNPDNATSQSSCEDGTYVGEGSVENDFNHLNVQTINDSAEYYQSPISPSQTREQEHRLDDDLTMLQAEQVASSAQHVQSNGNLAHSISVHRSRSRRSDPVDEFDVATNPLHEKTAGYKPPEHPSTNFAKAIKKIHNSSFLIRYFTYIVPVVALLLVPLLLGALVFKNASVGGVTLLWFSVWLELLWLLLWMGRVSPHYMLDHKMPSYPSTSRSLPNVFLGLSVSSQVFLRITVRNGGIWVNSLKFRQRSSSGGLELRYPSSQR